MQVSLPRPIAAYFAADSAGSEAVADCFTERAVVRDEGRIHGGRAAIRRWREEVRSKFDYVSEPFAVDLDGDRIVVTSRLTGNFPGSPVDLRYAFTLLGERIERLEIAP